MTEGFLNAEQMAAAKAGAALVRRGITFQSKSGQVTSPVRRRLAFSACNAALDACTVAPLKHIAQRARRRVEKALLGSHSSMHAS